MPCKISLMQVCLTILIQQRLPRVRRHTFHLCAHHVRLPPTRPLSTPLLRRFNLVRHTHSKFSRKAIRARDSDSGILFGQPATVYGASYVLPRVWRVLWAAVVCVSCGAVLAAHRPQLYGVS